MPDHTKHRKFTNFIFEPKIMLQVIFLCLAALQRNKQKATSTVASHIVSISNNETMTFENSATVAFPKCKRKLTDE